MDSKESYAENLTENDWAIILFVLFLDDMNAKDKVWEEFKRELVYQNRFHSSHAVVKELHEKQEMAKSILKEGSTLYRARVFDRSQFIKLVSYYLKSTGASNKEIQIQMESINDWEKYFLLLPAMKDNLDLSKMENDAQTAPILEAYKKWKRLRYKGFDSKHSGAPPADSIDPGRANPDHIRYLYLSEDFYTPVYEVRPIIGQTVSVARFTVKRDLKIFDLTAQLSDKYDNMDYKLPTLFNSIGRMFSKPYNGNPTEYIPTQYITEEIKHMGFDGVRFKSSLNEGGINVVLFSDEDCKAISSDLVTVRHIALDMEKPEIYRLLDHKKG